MTIRDINYSAQTSELESSYRQGWQVELPLLVGTGMAAPESQGVYGILENVCELAAEHAS